MRVSYKPSKIKTKKTKSNNDELLWKDQMDLKVFKLRLENKPMPKGGLEINKKIFSSNTLREANKYYLELENLCKLKK